MAFLIRSTDGRTTICTASADAAAEHAAQLRRLGIEVEITDINGQRYRVAGPRQRTADLKVMHAKILQAA